MLSCVLGAVAFSNGTESATRPQVLQKTTAKTSVHLCGSRHGTFK